MLSIIMTFGITTFSIIILSLKTLFTVGLRITTFNKLTLSIMTGINGTQYNNTQNNNKIHFHDIQHNETQCADTSYDCTQKAFSILTLSTTQILNAT